MAKEKKVAEVTNALAKCEQWGSMAVSTKRRAQTIFDKLVEYTGGELSEVEYVNLTFLQLDVEKINNIFVTIDDPQLLDTDLIKERRQSLELINGSLAEWRKGKKEKKTGLGELKDEMKKLAGQSSKVTITIEESPILEADFLVMEEDDGNSNDKA